MVDLIDRQAAIQAMLELQKEDDDTYGCHIPEAFHGERAAKALKALPSAQPPVITCDGCRHVGTYDTDFPCSACIRREKDYYDPER